MDEQVYKALYEARYRYNRLNDEKLYFTAMPKLAGVMVDALNLTQQQLILNIRNRGPMRISEIAKLFALKLPNATRLANRLVELGWCQKINQPDKRRVYLDLSTKGNQLLDEDALLARNHYHDTFEKYTTEKERKKLLELYNFAIEIMSRFP